MSLDRVAAGNFGAIAVFNVLNEASGKTYTYEYESSRLGSYTGVKGVVVLVDDEDKPVALALLQGPKFATGKDEYDAVGGFCQPGESPEATAKKELSEEMGIEPQAVLKVLDLGELTVDAGLTSNCPRLFAAFVRDGCGLTPGPRENLDPFELRSSVVVIPLEELRARMWVIQDSFTLAAIGRLMAGGHLVLPDPAK